MLNPRNRELEHLRGERTGNLYTQSCPPSPQALLGDKGDPLSPDSWFLRNCEIINVCGFHPLNFGEICYMAWITDIVITTLGSRQKVQIYFEPKILFLSSFLGEAFSLICGILLLIAPQPGIKSLPSALDAQSPNYCNCQKVQILCFLKWALLYKLQLLSWPTFV